MEIQELIREFKYNGTTLADPNPSFTLEQVRDFYAAVYPEILSAEIEGPEAKGNKNVYTFRRAVGTKGGHTLADQISDLGALLQAGWLEPRDADFVKDMHERLHGHEVRSLDADETMRLIALHRQFCASGAEAAA